MSVTRKELLTLGDSKSGDTSETLLKMDAALHDLSQPLTSVALALEVLSREREPDTVKSLLAAARKECARAIRDVSLLRVETNTLLNRTTESVRGAA